MLKYVQHDGDLQTEPPPNFMALWAQRDTGEDRGMSCWNNQRCWGDRVHGLDNGQKWEKGGERDADEISEARKSGNVRAEESANLVCLVDRGGIEPPTHGFSVRLLCLWNYCFRGFCEKRSAFRSVLSRLQSRSVTNWKAQASKLSQNLPWLFWLVELRTISLENFIPQWIY